MLVIELRFQSRWWVYHMSMALKNYFNKFELYMWRKFYTQMTRVQERDQGFTTCWMPINENTQLSRHHGNIFKHDYLVSNLLVFPNQAC